MPRLTFCYQDHEAIRHRLTLGEIAKARNLYELGGNSFPVAKLTLQAPRDAFNFPEGTKVYGMAKSQDQTVFGTLLEPVAWEAGFSGNVTLEVAYILATFDGGLPEENQCRVGGYYTFERASMNGCELFLVLFVSLFISEVSPHRVII